MTISDQLRDAVRSSGLSLYQLSDRAGINRSALSRFLAGEGLAMSSIDHLAGALGLQLATIAARRPTRARSSGSAKNRPAPSVAPAPATDPEAPGVWADDIFRGRGIVAPQMEAPAGEQSPVCLSRESGVSSS